MLLLDNEKISVDQIRNVKDSSPEIMQSLKAALDRIEELGWPITLKLPVGTRKVNARSGLKEGKPFISLKRHEVINTAEGTVTIRWAEQNTVDNTGKPNWGNPNYQFRKLRILNEGDIEEALFIIGVCSMFKAGRIVVEDRVAEANVIAERRAQEADIQYLFYGKGSELTTDRLIQLAYAWGVPGVDAQKDNINLIKNSLWDILQQKEKDRDAQFGFQAFIEASQSDETPEFLECMAIVRKAEENKVITWNKREFCWVIKGSTKEDDMVLLQINPSVSGRRRELLAQAIIADGQKKSMLLAARPSTPGANSYGEYINYTTPAQWKRVSPADFAAAKELAGIGAKVPDGIATGRLIKFFEKKRMELQTSAT